MQDISFKKKSPFNSNTFFSDEFTDYILDGDLVISTGYKYDPKTGNFVGFILMKSNANLKMFINECKYDLSNVSIINNTHFEQFEWNERILE